MSQAAAPSMPICLDSLPFLPDLSAHDFTMLTMPTVSLCQIWQLRVSPGRIPALLVHMASNIAHSSKDWMQLVTAWHLLAQHCQV